MDPVPDRHPQDMPVHLGPLVAGDDFEKNVRVNEDGSLSVEMKVRFHLLGEDPLLWSRRVRATSTLSVAGGERPVLGETEPLGHVWKGHSGDPSEPGAQGLGSCQAGGVGAFDRGRWQQGSGYEIWMNPLFTSQGERAASPRRSGQTHHACSRVPRSQGAIIRKRRSRDSVSPASSDRPPEGSELNSSCCSRSLEDGVSNYGPHLASRAGEGTGQGATPCGREHHHCPNPGACGLADAPPDTWMSAGSHEESSERGEPPQASPSKSSRATTSWGATQPGGPGSLTLTVSPSSLRNEDAEAEESGPGTQDRSGSGVSLSLSPGRASSGDRAGDRSPASARASTLGGSRKQEGRAGALSSPSISGLSQRAQRGRPKQRHHPKDPQCPLDSPVSRPVPRPPSRARACPEGPAPGLSGSPSSARKPGSWFSASLHSQDTRGLSSIAITPVSNSDSTPNLYSPNSPSAETEGGPGFQACSPAPTPSNTSGSFNSHTEQAEGDSPKPPWPLVLPVERPEGGRLGSHRGSCCSQLSTWSLAHRSPGKTQALPTSQPGGRQGPSSRACLACSRFCPMPPMPRPSGKRHPPRGHSQSEGNPSADGGVGGEGEGEEKLDVCHSQAPSSQEGPSGEAVRAVRRGSPCRGPRLRKFQGQDAGGGEGLEEQAEDGGMMLGALPRASPEAVVRAWLSNIPEEPMKYEMVDEGEDVAGLDPEGPEGDPVSTRSPDDLESSTQARQPSLEEATSEKAEPDGVLPVPGSASPTSGTGLPGSKVSEAPPEAETGKGAAVDHGMGQGRLPSTISASVQIIKVLKGSEQGRPSSLPEVSSSEGRRLGRSALALITCLARLHFFDDDLGSSTGKVRFLDSPRYQELLSTFQALWPGSGLGHRDLVSGLQELGWCQALRDLRSHAATEDFTPTSSSGVDVGSGSGGSGEGSGPCAVDCALVPERMELPLNVSCQRPDSGTSVNPEVPGDHQPSDSEACDTSEDGAERNSGEQTLGSDLGEGAENIVKEEGVQLEEIKEEKERAELQEEAAKGCPEEGGSVGRELPGAGSQNGAGAQEDAILQEKEAGGLVSATLSPPGRRESPTEPPGSLGERNSDASGSQSGPKAEPALEKLPRAAETGGGQTQAKLHQGAGERGTSTARRGSLGPDALWVSRLLKKMEKAFLDHLASATAELRARWGLQSNDLLDQMVAELQQDMGRRLQDSTERELHKIQSWAGGTALGPPREALRWEASLQTEQRRWRLRGLHNLSAFSEQMQGWGPLSFSLEDVPTFRGALGTQLGEEAEGEEFCPCEACMRKKAVPVSPREAVAASSAPIREAFDLQQILQKRKAGCADGGTAEVAPAKRGMEPLRRDPSGMDTVQGSGQGPGAEEGDKGEGSQTLGRDEGARKAEEAATQERGGETEPCVGSDPEQGVGKEEENTDRGSGAEDTQEGKTSGGGDRGPGEQDAGACTSEAQEAEGEEEPESGGNQGEREVGARAGQSGEASGSSSPDPEGRPVLSPAPEADTPCQRSGPKSGLSSCSTASLETCSQLSQKGSEDESSSRHTRNMEDESKDIPDPEKKVTGVHTESSTSEQEGIPLGLRTRETETEEDQAPEQEEEEDQAPEQEEEEDQAPEQEEEDQAPEQGAEEDQAPEQGAEEDQAPEQEAEGNQAPEQEEEEDQAPEQGAEEDQAPEQEAEGNQAPEQEEEEDQAPEQGAEEDQATEPEAEGNQAPEQEEEEDQAPEQGAEEDQAPEQEEEEDQAPEQEEEDQAPEQGAEEGSDLEAKKVVQSLTSTETSFKTPAKDRTDGFGQDDLDF
uniref:Retinitis pigmentosa 1-like 1 protein n=1 Tax=Sus scrofa TaxID=9823 RepID=A0A8D1I564_PIG